MPSRLDHRWNDVPSAPSDRPLRVLFVATSMSGGGAEWVGCRWMEWLVARGHTVTVAITSNKDTDTFIPDGVTTVRLGGLHGHHRKVAALREAIHSSSAQVVVALQMYPNLLAVAAVRSTTADRPAVVVSEHNIIAFGLTGAPGSHRVKTSLARRAYAAADHVIAVSHGVAGEMIGGFGVKEGRCTVVPNPAASKVTQREIPKRAAEGIDIDLVIAHRLVVQKRPQLAVQVAAELTKRGLRTRLTVFGEGPLLGELTALATQLDVDLDYRGWADQWFMECSDRSLFLLASNREGFGNVLIEAAAAGIPSVALSGALGVADAVVPGITGALALREDVSSIADAVERAATIRIGEIDPWLTRFTTATSGSALEDVLELVMASQPVRGDG